MILFLILVVLIFLTQMVEIFIPPLEWMFNARLYIAPIIMFYGAVVLAWTWLSALSTRLIADPTII